MKKILIILSVIIVILSAATLFLFLYVKGELPDNSIVKLNNKGEFLVFQNGSFLRDFKSKTEAVDFARQYSKTYVTKNGNDDWIWDNYPQFTVHHNDSSYIFDMLYEALTFAKGKTGSYIENRANQSVIWRESDVMPKSHIIENVPLIGQNPELERGCEVTALAMLLNYYGVGISKMDLAEQIEKDPTPYSIDKKGVITFGNPHVGFVGDMYTKENPGLGVYAGPVFDLLKEYIGSSAINLTGADFSDLYFFISKNKPVFVITNSTFKPLPLEKFLTWHTEKGPIVVTYSEHAVLIKGYDEDFVYFNDPLNDRESRTAPKEDFIKAWVQMGSQAVTYFD